MKAILKFLESRGKLYIDPKSSEDIIRELNEATMDKQLKQERERLLNISGIFQRQIADLFNMFMVIASKSLLARDEMGQFIIREYGGADSESLEALRKRAGEKKYSDYEKRCYETVELLLNWNNLMSLKEG